jgi:hypothetical protein
MCGLQAGQQQSLCNALGAQQQLTPNQVLSECQNSINALQPQFLGQAESQCNNELQSGFRNSIPSSYLPSNLYPTALQNAANLRFKLQNALNNLAQKGANQNTPFSELTTYLQPANTLQNQYQQQKSICFNLKQLQLIENQRPQLTSQFNQLIPNQNGYYNLEAIPQSARPQAYNLQKQLGGLNKLEIELATQLANAYSPYTQIPESGLESAAPSGSSTSPQYNACVKYICLLKCQ